MNIKLQPAHKIKWHINLSHRDKDSLVGLIGRKRWEQQILFFTGTPIQTTLPYVCCVPLPRDVLAQFPITHFYFFLPSVFPLTDNNFDQSNQTWLIPMMFICLITPPTIHAPQHNFVSSNLWISIHISSYTFNSISIL